MKSLQQHYLIALLFFASQHLYAQNGQWQIIPPSDLQNLRTTDDPEYNYGSEILPSPRTDAVSWSSPDGHLYIFGGIGFDENKQWGVFGDMWRYDPTSNSWKLIHGDRNRVHENGLSNQPLPRKDAASWVDLEGNLWLYGGRQVADLFHLDDMWKFNVHTATWSKISGKALFNQPEVRGQQKTPAAEHNPGSRSKPNAWTDRNGKLWLFGGIASAPGTDGKNDYFSDLWMFDTTFNRWQWVSGEARPNQAVPSAPTPRAASACWYQHQANQLWLYGGIGYDSVAMDFGGLSDLWCYDISKDTWERKNGKSDLNKELTLTSAGPEHENNHPGYRISPVTWTGKNSEFLLAAGQSSFGREHIYIEKNIWVYNPGSGKWRILPQADISVIGSASVFTDSEGSLYMFGGKELDRHLLQSRPSNTIRKIQY